MNLDIIASLDIYFCSLKLDLHNKIMIPRPIQRTISPNSPRLQYPLSGEYGFEEPVGKKKYSIKQSAIHQLIFNHPSPAVQHVRYQNSQKMRMLDYQAREYSESLANSRLSSNLPNNSIIYSPQDFQKMNSQNLEKSTSRSREYGNHKEGNAKMESIGLKQDDRRRNENQANFSRQISVLNDYKKKKKWEDQRSFDSLDRLLRPQNQYDLHRSKDRQKFLDQMIQYRSKSPTYLNSHLH